MMTTDRPLDGVLFLGIYYMLVALFGNVGQGSRIRHAHVPLLLCKVRSQTGFDDTLQWKDGTYISIY
jgi:hypothetical protein